MKLTKFALILSVLLCMCASCVNHHADKKNVLVVTDYGYTHYAFASFVSKLEAEFGTDDYEFRIVGYDASNVDSTRFAVNPQAALDSVRLAGFVPDLVLLFGDNVFHAAATCYDTILTHTPVIFADVLYPEYENIQEKRRNFTGFKRNMDIARNLDLIRDVRKNTWVTTCLDSGYLDDYIRMMATKQLADSTKYIFDADLTNPDMYVVKSKRDTSVMSLIPVSLEDESRNWIDREGFKGFDYKVVFLCDKRDMTYLWLKNDEYSSRALDYSLGNFFATTPDRFDLPIVGILNSCIGGYFTPYHVMMNEVHQVADEILFKWERPSDIPWKTHRCDYWLDWNVAKYVRDYASDFPSYVRFVNLPKEFRSPSAARFAKYGQKLLIGSLFLALVVALLVFLVRLQKKRQAIIGAGETAKVTREKTEDLLNANEGYLFVVSNDGSIHLSDVAYEKFGFDKGLTIDMLCEDINVDSRAEFRNLIEDRTVPVGEIDFEIKDHITSEVHVFKAVICHSAVSNDRLKAIGLFIVLDEQIKREKEIQRAFKKEEESVLKSSFLASMSHEIRTPLNAILGFSKLLVELGDAIDDEEKAGYGQIITSNTETLLSLIDNVISYSESQGKDLAIKLSEKNLEMLMGELYMTHSVIVPRELSFVFEKGSSEDVVMVNRTSLLQVVSNLMNNAVKFTKKGSITLGWTEEGDNAIIYVQDTGCGIREEFKKEMFTKFTKEDSSSEGAGIGLALCKRLVDKMNGELRVTSEEGKGSRFEVVLPLLKK